MQNNQDRKVLLKVDHLEQHFKLGKTRTLKAVNDVSFEIYKGEVFGLVGESGCGKSTTGRAIIRLLDATGGSVYFDGKRIVAGTRTYKEAITVAKKKHAELVKEVKKSTLSEDEKAKKIADSKAELDKTVAYNLEEIRSAKYDHKHCNKEFAKYQMSLVKEKYIELVNSVDNECKDFGEYKDWFMENFPV